MKFIKSDCDGHEFSTIFDAKFFTHNHHKPGTNIRCTDILLVAVLLISIRTFRGPSRRQAGIPSRQSPEAARLRFRPSSVRFRSQFGSLLCNYGALTAEQRARGVAESCTCGLTQPQPGTAGRRRVGAVFHK